MVLALVITIIINKNDGLLHDFTGLQNVNKCHHDNLLVQSGIFKLLVLSEQCY